MGYYTSHTLTVRGEALQNADAAHRILGELNEWLTARGIIGYALSDGACVDGRLFQVEIQFDYPDCCKWYEHDEDMTACSLAFPELTFCLHGEGEDQFDYWDTYYHNGESEECYVKWEIPKPTRIKWE